LAILVLVLLDRQLHSVKSIPDDQGDKKAIHRLYVWITLGVWPLLAKNGVLEKQRQGVQRF
jgi:hypothetical protein